MAPPLALTRLQSFISTLAIVGLLFASINIAAPGEPFELQLMIIKPFIVVLLF